MRVSLGPLGTQLEGTETRELARVFRSSHRQLGHSVAHGSECNVLSCVSIAVHAVVKQVPSV
jgi:uncharacterized protein YqgV (UPF0045/DUF77 family)